MDANVVVLGTDNVGKSGEFLFIYYYILYIHKMYLVFLVIF